MRRVLACLFLSLMLVSCNKANVTPAASPDLATAAPYQTVSPSPTPTVIPALTEVLLPTPTAILYTLKADDTLGSIAQRYGTTVDALLAANPGIQPSALVVGSSLIIPPASGLPGDSTPTPASLSILQARCWPETSGGLWCFALFQNPYAEPIEDLAAQFSLLDANGRELTSQIVYGLIDVLPAGGSLPLAAHFPPPVDLQAVPRVHLLTSIRLLPGDTSYLPVMLDNLLVDVDSTGRSAQVSGRAVLTGSGTANTLWILATAYDTAGEVVGVRRWEASSPLTADPPLRFEFQVDGIGAGIARVEFLAEARP
jgi:LysM repeat protein